MQALSETIANRQSGNNNLKPIANSTIVDHLLEDYKDLIDDNYIKWFAARFYNIPFDQIHAAASQARHDGKDSKRLFAFLIRKLSTKQQYQVALHEQAS